MQRICSRNRLTELRRLLRAHQLQAYIIPSEDEHFSEYVDPADRRYTFISGFTGSTCTAVVTLDKAVLWTDGRYFLQASKELDDNWTLMKRGLLDVPGEAAWLVSNTGPGSLIGFDPKQIPFMKVARFQKELAELEFADMNSNTLEPRVITDVPGENLVDVVWDKLSAEVARPPRRTNPIFSVPTSFSGITWQEKVKRVRERMIQKGVSVLAVSALDEIAWLLNLRGSDIEHNPVFFAYVLLSMDTVKVFLSTDSVRQSDELLKSHFQDPSAQVIIHPYDEFYNVFKVVVSSDLQPRVWFDMGANYAMVSLVPERRRLIATSPICEMKAIKFTTELEGIRHSHITDSLVLCDFLAWLECVAQSNRSLPVIDGVPMRGDVCDPAGCPAIQAPTSLTEFSVAKYLDTLRSQSPSFVSLSFQTISACDGNASIIHYHPSADQDSPISSSALFLVDSGAQYRTGTTDVTRTVHLNDPTSEQVACYTLVLKAHINLARQIFPDNTPGSCLDILARRELWNYQRNFAHGTGHGVGAFLCVHEGPIGISLNRLKAAAELGLSEPGLQENMVVTIEPGYYLDNQFGIRLENVVFVIPAATAVDVVSTTTGSSAVSCTKWLTFDPVTLVPFQRKLIDVSVLTSPEVTWINQYHERVRSVIQQQLMGELGKTNFDVTLLSSSRRRCWEWVVRETSPIT